MKTCPCCSQQPFVSCCEPYLTGSRKPQTAEALMRSRYSAFATRNVDYLVATHDHKRPEHLHRELKAYVHSGIQWLKLEVTETTQGQAKDKTGTVTFIATYLHEGQIGEIREKSKFRRKAGNWIYVTATEK